jgi:hypothetical protein
MIVWPLAVAAGTVPWVVCLALLWTWRGISLRRLLWPPLAERASAQVAEERLLAPRAQANRLFYLPLLVIAVVAAAAATAAGYAWGPALFSFLGTPSLLSLAATLRAYMLVRNLRRQRP